MNYKSSDEINLQRKIDANPLTLLEGLFLAAGILFILFALFTLITGNLIAAVGVFFGAAFYFAIKIILKQGCINQYINEAIIKQNNIIIKQNNEILENLSSNTNETN
ncbi:hypothetical protein AAEX28_08815 [Lentisphaerota bacterium WC36G]|nr:hypothetical protein LJT99_11665 [Lentisphaerae bacterium WC36]